MSERVTIVGHVVEPPTLRRSARGLAWTRVQVESVAAGHALVEATAFGGLAERCASCLASGDRAVIVAHHGEKGVVADEVAISLRHDPAHSVRPATELPAGALVVPAPDPLVWEEDY